MNIAATAQAATLLPDAQIVTEVTHYTDRLFSFRVTRPTSLRFRSGEFVMIGLPGDGGKPILRAYSIASPAWDETLQFYSIKVQDGPLTSRLQKIVPGDQVILRPKPVGTLVLDALLPGKRLWMVATGTGIAPFASLLREPDVWASYDSVILTHTCRLTAELAFGQNLITDLPNDPLVGEDIGNKFTYFPTITQQPFAQQGRVTDWLTSGRLHAELNIPALDLNTDRVMICGSIGLNKDMKRICEAAGLTEGSNASPGHFVVEKAFVG